MSKTGTLRLRSIRYKDGRGSLRVVPDFRDKDRPIVEAHIKQMLDIQGNDIAGFAFVVWGADKRAMAYSSSNSRSVIPPIMVPDFVRERLLAEKIMEWSREDA